MRIKLAMEVSQSNLQSNEILSKSSKIKSLPSHLTQTKNSASGKCEIFCTICQKTIRSRTQKYYHYGCSNDELKNYKCDKCAKAFSTRAHLNYHLESHNSNEYHCQNCDKTFSNRLVYEKHLKLHQRTILFPCPNCEKQFRNKHSLVAHSARHENLLEFECDICLKRYATKSALGQHKLKHSDKKYECTHCQKHFQRNSILNLHLKRVGQREVFNCDICAKKFADSTSLQRHMKLHKDGVTKYKCKQCDIVTLRKDNMQRHMRNMHNGEKFSECVEIVASESQAHEICSEDCSTSALGTECGERYLPKTVANSSVIKCVGNVEPVKVPNMAQHLTENVVQREEIKEIPTRPEKIKTKYDPIKMYRKILSTNEKDDDESCNEERNENTQTTEKRDSNARSATSSISNFSATHWRKNYKYTYQQQEY